MKKLSFTKIALISFFLMTVYAFIFYKELLTGYALLFNASAYTKGADAVLILSGNPETRVEKAVEVYRAGYAKAILLTSAMPLGSKYYHIFKTQLEKMHAALAYEGISEYTVVPSLKGGATSTFDEAYDVVRYAKEHNLTHLIIVTDTFHTARALYAFKKVFKKVGMEGVKLEAAGASNNYFNATNWWHSEMGLTHYFLEPLKFLVYCFRSTNLEIIKESP